jgi:HAD superfamily hydrolase (TIGR01459 family)
MTKLYLLDALAALHDRYDAVLCDIWGVIHDGGRAHPAAARALQAFRAAGKSVVLVSNVPKPASPIYDQLDERGFPRDAYDAIVTSGDAIRAVLAAQAPGPVFKIGTPRYDDILWEGLGLEEAPLEEAAFLGVSGLRDPETETPETYGPLLRAAKARDLDFFCANPDIVVRVGRRLIWCAGALARDYEALGGRVIMAGKPHAPVYALAYQALSRLTGATVPKGRILAIGDGPATDLLGANRESLDALYIGGGVTTEALRNAFTAEAVAEALGQSGVFSRYAMRDLS